MIKEDNCVQKPAWVLRYYSIEDKSPWARVHLEFYETLEEAAERCRHVFTCATFPADVYRYAPTEYTEAVPVGPVGPEEAVIEINKRPRCPKCGSEHFSKKTEESKGGGHGFYCADCLLFSWI